MDITQASPKKNVALKVALSAMLAVTCCSVFFAYSFYANFTTLKRENSEMHVKLDSLTSEKAKFRLAADANDALLAKAKQEAAEYSSELSKLKESTGAFAQQAASCEAVKRKLGATSL